MPAVQLGIDNLLATQPDWLRSVRIGLLANQASVDNRLRHTQNRLLEAGANLTAIFAPQHGYLGEQQANMIESDDFIDKHLFSRSQEDFAVIPNGVSAIPQMIDGQAFFFGWQTITGDFEAFKAARRAHLGDGVLMRAETISVQL